LGSSASAAAILGNPVSVQSEENRVNNNNSIPAPTQSSLERDVGDTRPPNILDKDRAAIRPGSDLMVQVLKDLNIEYIAANPASSFEALQESIVNYGSPPNTYPELITALHEESAVDMAHGYAKSQGHPMAVMLHGTVGLQHAAMAIYQCYHDKTPVLIIVGRDDTFFRQEQTANDIAGLTRAFTKWDSQPESLESALSDIQRAFNEAITPPMGPTVVVLDTHIQKEEAGNLVIPNYQSPVFKKISRNQARKIAEDLLGAENPRLHIGRLRTPEGIADAVRLAELTGSSVRTSATAGPMSFPERHPLCGNGGNIDHDYILGLESDGKDTSIQGPTLLSNAANRDITNIGFGFIREPVIPPRRDLSGKNDITADAESSLPLIINEFETISSSDPNKVISNRIESYSKENLNTYQDELKKTLEKKRKGWNSSPVSLARLYSELWPMIKDLDWCLSSPTVFSSRHHVGMWDHNKPYSYLGMHGAGGIGYCIGASAGAGLAAKKRERIVINIQCDGDLNYTPGSLWTAAHHKLPVLTIMHNNRGYHQEVMYLHYMAGVRGRGTDRMHIGTTLRDPFIDYAKLAEAYGMNSEGPIENPDDLKAAFSRGIRSVLDGEPYLIDVITEPR
tara:strand:+ start:4701 stop:6566 length:1866 start_codon:yes stop_codon:yes gene_type:complete